MTRRPLTAMRKPALILSSRDRLRLLDWPPRAWTPEPGSCTAGFRERACGYTREERETNKRRGGGRHACCTSMGIVMLGCGCIWPSITSTREGGREVEKVMKGDVEKE